MFEMLAPNYNNLLIFIMIVALVTKNKMFLLGNIDTVSLNRSTQLSV